MSATFTDEQQELQSSARRFLAENSSSEKVRSVVESETGFDAAAWKQIAELGWLGIALPEEFGGAGYGFSELAILLEEMGKALFPAPFLSSAVLGALAILQGGSDEQRKRYLPGIIDGSTRAALAFVESSGNWAPGAFELKATPSGDGYRLDGTKSYVIDGGSATLLVVSAAIADGVGLFIVDGEDASVERKKLEVLDATRKQAMITFDGTGAEALEGDGLNALQSTLDLGAVALAAESVGTAQACLDMSVEYANTRIQFGRPIGSFQGVKHKCADMLTAVELARSAAYYGAWAAAEEPDELPVASCVAKAWCSDAVIDVASKNVQIHGGIGFTWEHDAHMFLRRAKGQELYLGDADYHRALLLERMGL